MKPRDVIVVGGSAGSMEPLRRLAAALPAGMPGSVAAHARSGEPLRPGHIYGAPPGCHLLMPEGVIELSNGPRMNRVRPAIDAMFASAARWFGDRVVAVVLSGVLDDGAVGAALVEQAGGLAAPRVGGSGGGDHGRRQ